MFNRKIKKYNCDRGNIEGVVNMGKTLPLQHTGTLLDYNRETLVKLHNKLDELESLGVHLGHHSLLRISDDVYGKIL